VAVIVSILAFGAVAGVIRQSGWNEGFLYGLTASGGETAKDQDRQQQHDG